MKNLVGFFIVLIGIVFFNGSVKAEVYNSVNIKLHEQSDVVGTTMKVTLDDVTREVTVTVHFSREGSDREFTTTADKDVENGQVSYAAFYYQSRGLCSAVRLYLSVDDRGKLSVNTRCWSN